MIVIFNKRSSATTVLRVVNQIKNASCKRLEIINKTR